MPLYEYRCSRCGHTFEKIQKFSAKPKATCPSCGGTAKRQLSPPAIRFKGSGWYVTDYSRKGKKQEDKPSGGTDKSGSKEGSSSSGAEGKGTSGSGKKD